MGKDEIKEDFDPSKLAKKAIEANLDVSIFTKIDDRDIPRAPNWLTWCIGERFLNMEKLFPRQIQIATEFFAEYCPRCSKPKYINDLFDQKLSEIMDNVSFLEYGICPKCKTTQNELIVNNELVLMNEANAVAGRRASKTVTNALISTYHLHRYLGLPNPSKHFGLLSNQMLHMIMTAVTAEQAEDTVWQNFKDVIDASNWFANYHNFLDEIQKKLGLKDPLYQYKPTFLAYSHKRLSAYYMSPNIRTIRGRTAFATMIDEIGWFDQNAESGKILANAEETHIALASSLANIRAAATKLINNGANWTPTAIDLNFSSPSTANDMIMRLVRSSSKEKKSLGVHYSTWEWNPNITREDCLAEAKDMKAFEREFAAIPPIGIDQYLPEEIQVKRCFTNKQQLITYSSETIVDPVNPKLRTIFLNVVPKIKEMNQPRILSVDTGKDSNSFALALLSYDFSSLTINVDAICECVPIRTKDENVPVNFPKMFEHAIVPLIKNFNIIQVVYDHWNSVEAVQKLRYAYKISSEQYTIRWDDDWTRIRACIYDGKLSIPKNEYAIEDVLKHRGKIEDLLFKAPLTHLLYQMLTVREVGKKVTKPINGTDDLFRAMAIGMAKILDPENTKRFIYSGGDARRMRSGSGKTIGVIKNHLTGPAITRVDIKNSGKTVGVRKSFKFRTTY